MQYISYFFAIMFIACWLFWASLFWCLAYTLAKTHGASFSDSLKVIFRKNPREALGRSTLIQREDSEEAVATIKA